MEDLDDYTKACPTCDSKRYTIELRGERVGARICGDCFDTCPACHGQEYTYDIDERGYEIARRCPVCGALNRRIQAFNDASLPRRHCDARLDNFQTHYEGSQRPLGNLHKVRFSLYNWVRGFTPGDRGFLLHGPVGTGKTHLLAGVIRRLTLEKGISAKFIEFTHLLSDIRRQFDRGKGETAILQPIINLPVLAIDELGKGRKTNWQLSIIDEIISKRYNQSLTTLFTTNYAMETNGELPSGDTSSGDFRRQMEAESLPDRVGQRVFSRLHDMADFIELKAPDYRRRSQRP